MAQASQVHEDAHYLKQLGLSKRKLPRHVAIIMDGNGRWAQKRGLPRIEGHRRGVRSVRATVEECCRLGIEHLTLYCLSIENWKRPKGELDLLMHLLRQYLIDERPTIMEQNVRLRMLGRREGLPADVLHEMDFSTQLSASNTGLVLRLAINYGGRTELVDAVRRLAAQSASGSLLPTTIDEETITGALYEPSMPDPDLLIRTAGEQRVSNFLLWQISYAEIWIADVCWPDFGPSQLHDALFNFAHRERRYGGLTG